MATDPVCGMKVDDDDPPEPTNPGRRTGTLALSSTAGSEEAGEGLEADDRSQHERELAVEVRPMAIDPVCGMEVNEDDPAATYEYGGTTYYFCAPGCRTKFEKDPDEYLDDEGT